ncbi:MAG TPA: hypothetical protein PLE28_03120 [bacterium]|nr:hypothetical protein [bacterium]
MPIKTSLINIRNNQNKSFVQAGFIEPSVDKEKAKEAGLLFFLVEINQPDKMAEKIIFVITQLLEKNYYLNEKIFLSDQINGLKIESVFESALVKTNRELLEFIDQERINFNFKSLNLIVGLEHQERIYFSSIGQNKSFLIHKTDKACNISDINPEGNDNELEELISGKIFSSIISGEIPEKSYIVFTNDSLSQYLINDNFIKILDELKIDGAIEQIKLNLDKINNYSNFCALFIQNSQSIIENDIFYHPETNLASAKETTEKLLEEPGSINTENLKKKTVNILEKINILEKLLKPFKALGKIKIKKEKISDIITTSPQKQKIKKILLIIAGLLLIALLVSIFWKKNNNDEVLIEENASSYEELILQKQNQIESSLLYNNETQAKENIFKLQEILNSLSDKEKNKIKDYEAIEEKLNEQIRSIQKMNKINEPTEIINFSNSNAQANIQTITLNTGNNKLYTADGQNHVIYSVNLSDNSLNKISEDTNISSDNALSSIDSDNNVYILGANKLATINSKEEVSFSNINIENRNNITSFGVYNGRSYLLDKEKNQILKYEKDGSKYTNWLKDNTGLEPINLAIDYEIYVLTENALVNKYLSGAQQEFALAVVDPVLDKATNIKVGKNYIFVLDKSNQRMLIFLKKDGTFINQYSCDKFTNLKDFSIDETNKKAYFLNDNSIYSINLIF